MTRLSAYANEIVSLIVMLLMIAAIISGQASATARALTLSSAADNVEIVETSHIRLEDE